MYEAVAMTMRQDNTSSTAQHSSEEMRAQHSSEKVDAWFGRKWRQTKGLKGAGERIPGLPEETKNNTAAFPFNFNFRGPSSKGRGKRVLIAKREGEAPKNPTHRLWGAPGEPGEENLTLTTRGTLEA